MRLSDDGTILLRPASTTLAAAKKLRLLQISPSDHQANHHHSTAMTKRPLGKTKTKRGLLYTKRSTFLDNIQHCRIYKHGMPSLRTSRCLSCYGPSELTRVSPAHDIYVIGINVLLSRLPQGAFQSGNKKASVERQKWFQRQDPILNTGLNIGAV
jgi:hypothetical protein